MQKPSKTYCTRRDLEPDRDELTTLRHRIHQHPELSHKEVETARLVAEKLKAWGYEVTEGVGGTGVVGAAQGRQRHAKDRHPRRHGRAADHRRDGPALREHERGRHARVRPRRPHDDTARRGEADRGDEEFLRHGAISSSSRPRKPASTAARSACSTTGSSSAFRATRSSACTITRASPRRRSTFARAR